MVKIPTQQIRLKMYRKMVRKMEAGSTDMPVSIMCEILEDTSFTRDIRRYPEILAALNGKGVLTSWYCKPTAKHTIKRMNRIIKDIECK